MLNLIHTKNLYILDQLKIEEYLLKNSKDSYCMINEGTSPAIVLGACNKKEKLVNLCNAKKDKIPLIKRITGGGTVFVDQNTLFISFIFSKDFLKIDLFPESIIRWAESFYKPIFQSNAFNANENDFVIGDKKIGGNAKYIKKDRFLIHTSFLLDYQLEKINNYLLMPDKAPLYRKKRTHQDFLCPINSFFSKDFFIAKIKQHLVKNFKISIFDYSILNLKDLNFIPKTIEL